MEFSRKSKAAISFLCKTRNRIQQISGYGILQYQITVASDFISPSRLLEGTSQQPVQHLFPIHKKPEIRTFIIVADQITIQAHSGAAGRGEGYQIVGHLMILHIFMGFPDSHY